METFTYILAPHTTHNYAVVLQAIAGFPDLVDKKQIGRATPKSPTDIVDSEGDLMLATSIEQYIYVKADTAELESSGLLDFVQDYQLFTYLTQPTLLFWLNVQ